MIDESLKRELDLFADQSERWKQDHQQAMACCTFEEVLSKGVLVFDMITSADERWRAAVCAERTTYDPQVDEAVRAAYQAWLSPCEAILKDLDYFERTGFFVEHAKQFRSRWREAVGILTADDQFFAHDKLVEARDHALDELEADRTHEHGAG